MLLLAAKHETFGRGECKQDQRRSNFKLRHYLPSRPLDGGFPVERGVDRLAGLRLHAAVRHRQVAAGDAGARHALARHRMMRAA